MKQMKAGWWPGTETYIVPMGDSMSMYTKQFNYEFNPACGWLARWGIVPTLPKDRGIPVWCELAEWPLEDSEQYYIKSCRK